MVWIQSVVGRCLVTVLYIRCTVAAQSLCSRCAVAAQSLLLCSRCAVAVQSLHNRCVAVQSLCSRCTIAVQSMCSHPCRGHLDVVHVQIWCCVCSECPPLPAGAASLPTSPVSELCMSHAAALAVSATPPQSARALFSTQVSTNTATPRRPGLEVPDPACTQPGPT